MVIFHSYVKLPEGITLCGAWISCSARQHWRVERVDLPILKSNLHLRRQPAVDCEALYTIIYIYMIIYVYIRTIKHLKVRLPHSFSVGDCKWSQRFRVSIPKCTRPSWGAIVNRCTSQMRDHAVTHPTLIPWSSSIRSYRRVLYKACDVEGFRKEVVLFKDLSQQLF
jgi:hypothetical protein